MSRPAQSQVSSRTFFARLGTAIRRVQPAGRSASDAPAGVARAPARVRAMPTPLRPPASPTEHEALHLVRRERAVPLDVLARDVARHLYTAEVQCGGWVATVDHFGPHTYLPGVTRVIQEAHGVLWYVEPVDDTGAAEAPTSHPPHLEGGRS